MSVSNVGAAKLANLAARRPDHPQHAVGEQVKLKVDRQLDDRHYMVSFRDAQRVVRSTLPLTVGSTVRAVVTAVGEKLELRYVSADAVAVAMADHEAAGEDALAELAARYSVELPENHHAVISQAMLTCADPDALASGGIFLSKLSLPVDAPSLQALYSAQMWAGRVAAASSGAIDLDDLLPESGGNPGQLAALIGRVLDADPAQANAAANGLNAAAALSEQMPTGLQSGATDGRTGERDDQRQLAQRLLNEQDRGSVSYRYGVLPVLIGGQLLELDLVYFRERRESERAEGLRRFVMTFKAPALGRVEVLAQTLGDRLSIGIKAESARSSEALAAHAIEVRELIGRMGWNVESVSYDFNTKAERAARHVLDHVLNAETLSRLV